MNVKPDENYLVCDIRCVHQELIDRYGKEIINPHKVNELAALFKSLEDPTRVRIMDALTKNEFCVCDLAAILGRGDGDDGDSINCSISRTC